MSTTAWEARELREAKRRAKALQKAVDAGEEARRAALFELAHQKRLFAGAMTEVGRLTAERDRLKAELEANAKGVVAELAHLATAAENIALNIRERLKRVDAKSEAA